MNRRVRNWRWPAVFVVLALLGAASFTPTETKQGIDFSVSTYSLPLYAKALDFVQRDLSYARLVRRITPPGQSPEQRTLTLFEWTRANIRDTPEGFPIVDDHVLNSIIRGYGQSDQKADVFTTLDMYAGVPAFMSRRDSGTPDVVLSFVWLDGSWKVFDVQNGIVFRDRSGHLASADDLGRDRSLIAAAAGGRVYRSRPYESLFDGFRPPVALDILRPELQMLWPRMWYPLKRFVGLGGREWQRAGATP